MATVVLFTSARHTSFFTPKNVPTGTERRINQRGYDRDLFIWLLMDTVCHCAIASFERQAQSLRHKVTKLPGDQAFELLNSWRREVVDAQDLSIESMQCCIAGVRSIVHWFVRDSDSDSVSVLNADQSWSQKPIATTNAGTYGRESHDIKNIPE